MDVARILDTLKTEFIPAVGCTEPVAIALACAVAYNAIGGDLHELHLELSPNMFKNARAVGIPGIQHAGIDTAALLGVVLDNPRAGLEVFSAVSPRHVSLVQALKKRCTPRIEVKDDTPSVYVRARVVTDRGTAAAATVHRHTDARLVEVNGHAVDTWPSGGTRQEPCSFSHAQSHSPALRTLGSLPEIASAILSAPASDLDFLCERAEVNLDMAEAGLTMDGGLGIGRIGAAGLRGCACDAGREQTAGSGVNVGWDLALYAAAACDARMAGVQKPVVTCAGSGNLGISATVPVLLGARRASATREKLARALALSLATTIYVKEYFGRLSPVCGCAVAAGAGTAAGLVHLWGGWAGQSMGAVTNVLATLAGMLCDGGKVGCALKVWTSVTTASQAALLALAGCEVPEGNGIVGAHLDETLSNLARVTSEGMRTADRVMVGILAGGPDGRLEPEENEAGPATA
ncbi:MAG: L-serine ammonia-lyase, iron-sulfur-dependent, subunit alpha [Firmicutes bacterium]|jgi:L-cysteine desulfidase|nr:L-serine ammonia-lyase, iron-sulfur-dependent, subunit alpha [Bacillota bacterium]